MNGNLPGRGKSFPNGVKVGGVMNFHVFRERREQGWSTGCINRGGRAIVDDSHSNFY